MQRTLGAALMLSAVLLGAAACGDQQDGENAMADSAGMTAGATASTAVAAGGSAGANPGGMTDPNIMYLLDQANMADSAHGALASTMATDAEVKEFGQMMMTEHHNLREQGQQLATRLNATLSAPQGDQSEAQNSAHLTMLQGMQKGPAWDRAYIDHEVTMHTQVLQTAQTALAAAQNAELKDLISKATPVIQRHLDRARQLQTKLSSM